MTLPASVTLTQSATGPIFQLANGATQPALTPSYAAWLTGLAPAASQAQLANGSVTFLVVQPATTGASGAAVPAAAYSAEMSQVAAAAAPIAAASVLVSISQLEWITIAAPTALTLAAHGGKGLILLPGASISLAWGETGATFGCLVSNETGAAIQPQLDTAFTYPVVRNASGETQIADQGTAALYCQSWTDSTGTVQQVCRMVGETVA